MTTFAADHDAKGRLLELDDRTRTAWEDYRSSISGLAGEAYEDAELVSWERLQHALHDLVREREQLAGDAGHRATAG